MNKDDVLLILNKIDEVKDTLINKIDDNKKTQDSINQDFAACKGRGSVVNKIVFMLLGLVIAGNFVGYYYTNKNIESKVIYQHQNLENTKSEVSKETAEIKKA